MRIAINYLYKFFIYFQTENENLTYELEGYKNEAHLAKNEAERKFEKFKAHFIAQQALQNKQVIYRLHKYILN